MPAIQSSMITHVDYDAATQTMQIAFKSGSTYAYSDVPESEYETLISASSPGRHFLQNVKGQYSDRQI